VADTRLSKNLWSWVGLATLTVVAAVVVVLAVRQYRVPATPTTWATPATVSGATSASVPVPSTSTLPSTSAASSTPTASPTGLALANSILSAPSGASVLVIGDGTGDATNEWVAVWARDHLATNATVSYSAWGWGSSQYATAVRYGTTGQTIAVWNASVRSPDMALEPARIAKAWQTSDLVLLSYGHRRTPATITAQMDAVLAAIRAKNATVPVVVMIQNPDRADTETIQRENTQKVQAWAGAHGFATVDIYSAFMADPTPRNTMVESDGSPSPQGSQLWATTLAAALKAA
jgi:hypothetical protein